MLNVLYFYISSSRNVCAEPNMAVFCSSLISCFSSMFLNYFEIMMFGLVFGLVLRVCTFWFHSVVSLASNFFLINIIIISVIIITWNRQVKTDRNFPDNKEDFDVKVTVHRE